ncbi:ABC transporter ATP-binding protein [Streptomyces sp. NPDC057067]|uniref:ATP-binding cassette domain-containing protein n=2 Tax=Streptomyces TaxID=1883 RepID=A0AAU1LZF0_9ACTN|nr:MULTISPECIES: ATP-binding cassette domain-containing protein [unclassified Streptomyces]MDX3328349.1 ATP-binding cassette domain-containing protein [Streptomyces sp. ME02-6979-3A]MDX3430740.1 ATP-binding cassette domain-containing protein [Streptomyces sp. ME01-18a]
MTATPPVLRVRDVDLVRDGNHILSEVSLTVRAGEHWALLGANGAGKSTLLGLLGALTHPTRGTVEVLGHELGRVDLRQLRTYVGHVDPRHALRSPLRVRDVVLTGLTNSIEPLPRWRPTAEQLELADSLTGLLGLAGRREARWPTLSQGERGRALIARALMPQPRLLLLDEPATGLDVAGREQLIERLDTLQQSSPELASVLVTHHLEELPPGTTHVMLLRDGRCLASGPADEVLTSDQVSKCFDHPVHLSRFEGRWSVRTNRRPR